MTDDERIKSAITSLTKAKSDAVEALKHKGEERRKMMEAAIIRATGALAKMQEALKP